MAHIFRSEDECPFSTGHNGSEDDDPCFPSRQRRNSLRHVLFLYEQLMRWQQLVLSHAPLLQWQYHAGQHGCTHNFRFWNSFMHVIPLGYRTFSFQNSLIVCLSTVSIEARDVRATSR